MEAPTLNIPPSSSTVSVSIIDTTAFIRGVDSWKFFAPNHKGHEFLATPCYSFLIKHRDPSSGKLRQLIFDLGIRKDWQNLSPFLQRRFGAGGYQVSVQKSVREILEEGGVACDAGAIEGLIWSHWHFDHTGNPSEFPSETKLIVGPGFKENILPGYPANPDSAILEADYEGRELSEISFTDGLRIGRFSAFDYFGDGSFYLLDSPGHAIGHMCGLARVTSAPDSFVFMGGDIAHHAGEWRPSLFMPLPDSISPHPFTPTKTTCGNCPGAMFEKMNVGKADSAGRGQTAPFYTPAKLETGQVHYDVDVCVASIKKMQEYDAQSLQNILVAVAHDDTLLGEIDFFPSTINDFVKKGWVSRLRWRFLRDFSEAIGWEGEVEGKKSYKRL